MCRSNSSSVADFIQGFAQPRHADDVSPLMVTTAIYKIPTFIVLPLIKILAREIRRAVMHFAQIENCLFTLLDIDITRNGCSHLKMFQLGPSTSYDHKRDILLPGFPCAPN